MRDQPFILADKRYVNESIGRMVLFGIGLLGVGVYGYRKRTLHNNNAQP